MLGAALDTLEAVYGLPAAPPTSDPFELIVWEAVAYLADDAARAGAFARLRQQVGTRPEQIRRAPPGVLEQIGRAGILPASSAAKLRACAAIALEHADGDLTHLGRLPLAQARRALRRFPGLGEPGADKILLLARLHPVLAFDSNGLRALVRLGYGREARSYAATCRSALAAVQTELPRDASFDWLIRAHLLLRQHGQQVCRRSTPVCGACPLYDTCAYARAAR
jgi:endonuclease III